MTDKGKPETRPVLVVMGSDSDWGQMQEACKALQEMDISHYVRITSAHRTPERMTQTIYDAAEHGFKVVIAAAGGSAHLQGMSASKTRLPVLAVAIESPSNQAKTQAAIDSCIYMPGGVPLFFMGVGVTGARNAGLGAARILALSDQEMARRCDTFIVELMRKVPEVPPRDFDPGAGYPEEWR